MAEVIPRRRDDETGVTLVELLVVMVLMGILGTLVVTSSLATRGAAATTSHRLESIGDGQIATNAIARSMRAAVRPTSTAPLLRGATPRRLEYLAQVPGEAVPEKVVVSVIDRELVLDRWDADPSSGPNWTFSGTPTRRPLLANVPDDLDVFTYRDLDRCAVGSVCPALPMADANGLSPEDRNGVDVVDLAVSAEAPGIEPFELVTTVVLRNQGFVPDAGG